MIKARPDGGKILQGIGVAGRSRRSQAGGLPKKEQHKQPERFEQICVPRAHAV
jgi:hypothetical protein